MIIIINWDGGVGGEVISCECLNKIHFLIVI